MSQLFFGLAPVVGYTNCGTCHGAATSCIRSITASVANEPYNNEDWVRRICGICSIWADVTVSGDLRSIHARYCACRDNCWNGLEQRFQIKTSIYVPEHPVTSLLFHRMDAGVRRPGPSK